MLRTIEEALSRQKENRKDGAPQPPINRRSATKTRARLISCMDEFDESQTEFRHISEIQAPLKIEL